MDEIRKFIFRRFKHDDCEWMTTNSYWFAVILKNRFNGEIWYDSKRNHFVFYSWQTHTFYDWASSYKENTFSLNDLSRWSDTDMEHSTQEWIKNLKLKFLN